MQQHDIAGLAACWLRGSHTIASLQQAIMSQAMSCVLQTGSHAPSARAWAARVRCGHVTVARRDITLPASVKKSRLSASGSARSARRMVSPSKD